ncbi:MAG TPA: histidine phosphatase family protein [Microvirga sp.]|jgi:broad specificity phosphatase PhoE
MAFEIHLIRHGQSTFNAVHAATGVDPGHPDAPLTELGRQQVAAARERLEPIAFDLVVASPLTRAIQTATGIFGHRSIPLEVTCRHRERLESSCDVGRGPHELAADFPHLGFDHLQPIWWHVGEETNERGFCPEPADVFQERVTRFGEWLLARPERRIAVVGHGTFFHAMTGRFLANCESILWEPEGTTLPDRSRA